MRHFLKLSLLIIPIVIFLTSLQVIKEKDTDWFAAGYDPSYAYLYNSLNIATFRLVGHFDHPGTTMQVAGAVVLWGTWITTGDKQLSLTESVLSDPEHYLRVLNNSTALFASLVMLLLGILLYHSTKKLWIALLFQISPFISGMILYNGFTRTSQESMLMTGSLLMAALAILWLYSEADKHRKLLLYFGIASGFGLASKIIFAPLMLLPLIIFRSKKERVRYLKISAISFIGFTLPIITLYPRMGWWFIRLFIHSGIYGSGSATVIEPLSYFSALKELIITEKYFSVIWLLIFTTIIVRIIREGRKTGRDTLLLSAILIVQTLGFFITAKHPKAAYLLPYECLSVTGIIIIIGMILSGVRSNVLKYSFIILAVPFSCIFFINHGLASIKRLYSTNGNPAYVAAWNKVNTEADIIIGVNPGPSPIAAAYFGNTYSWNHYGLTLNKLYPHYYILDTYKNRLTNFNGDIINEVDISKGNQVVAIIGADLSIIKPLKGEEGTEEVINFIPGKLEICITKPIK